MIIDNTHDLYLLNELKGAAFALWRLLAVQHFHAREVKCSAVLGEHLYNCERGIYTPQVYGYNSRSGYVESQVIGIQSNQTN